MQDQKIRDKVRKYMGEHHMVEEGDRIIAGVSGGADSVALFCLLEELRKSINFVLYVVHVNHGLRGEEARRDADFVEELCREKEIPFYLYVCDVKQLAKEWGMGIEETGRRIRQQVFLEQMQAWNGNKLALAHHANDLAETMLHHLCRGTGVKGLGGIRPVQGEKIRPLLCLERVEIEHYLEVNKISYVHDSSNDSDDHTRNRIRHRILPLMEEQVNSGAVTHMANTAERLGRIDDYLQRVAWEVLLRYGKPEADSGFLSDGFFGEDCILQEYAVLTWVEQICRGRKDVTAYHVKQVLRLKDKPVGKYVELPGGYRVVRRYEGIFLEKVSHKQEQCNVVGCNLPREGQISFEGGLISTHFFPYVGQEIPEKKYTKWLNYDKINEVLQVRTREQGDFLIINALGGRKKLKDYFIDCKIQRKEREKIPLIAMGQEVLWVIGYRISEAYKVTKDTKYVLEIEYTPAHKGGKTDGGGYSCYDQ